ncbi:MAG: alpha/beta hydrolase [Coleofasciculus sp. B1-GNL1-01]|uniref:alpha/beta fold hydrolase n=1 Tax=Coleofasciculus sp. B1-GNL1-01 TaxID=3068484 RepID=UPI0032F2E819
MTITSNFPIPSATTEFYSWRNYRCAYDYYQPNQASDTPLVLLHPIGVGLSRWFWYRFCQQWYQAGYSQPIYNPDLLGCGDSDMPHVAYHPTDWAQQLNYFLQTIVKKPAIVVVQGAELPVALSLVQLPDTSNHLKGLVLSGPPSWAVMTQETSALKHKFAWNLFDSPFGRLFYRYARRRQFLRSFSSKQLFAEPDDIDEQWLDSLRKGATDTASRHAVFSFLSGFWRQDYQQVIASIQQPTLVVFGEQASSISREGKTETPEQRLDYYVKHFPQGQGYTIAGRNVLPYESTAAFVSVVGDWINQQKLT